MRERKVRIFLSSTFRDMNAERDHLVNIVFPRISTFCCEREVEFIPLDLRWGITESEQRNGRVITTCLEEVDNSRPFFIGLLGERYGWVPKLDDLSNVSLSSRSSFGWIEQDIAQGMSITEMEMQYAALRDNAIDHAAFYLRSPAIENPNPEFRERPGSPQEAKLRALKEKITSQDRYPVTTYDSITQLGEQVYRDVTTMIDAEFKPLPEERSLNHKHAFAVQQRCGTYVEDTTSMTQLNAWYSGAKKSILVEGAPESGKSSLVCNWVKQMSKDQPETLVIYHDYSLNDSHDSSPIFALCEHIAQELSYKFGFNYNHLRTAVGCLASFPKFLLRTFAMIYSPSMRSEMLDKTYRDIHSDISEIVACKAYFKELSRRKQTVTYIVIDNIDSSDDDLEQTIKLMESLPRNVRVIFTATINSTVSKELKERLKCEVVGEPRFTWAMAREFTTRYLERHSKRFSPSQYQLLERCKLVDSPALMRLILNRLIAFGSFEDLDNKLAEYSHIATQKDLIARTLGEVIEEFDGIYERNPLELALVAIAASHGGLSEGEIELVCGFRPLEWSMVRGHVAQLCHYSQQRFIITSQLYRDTVIELSRDDLRKVVLDNMFTRFESMIDPKTRSDGSYGPNVNSAFNHELVAKENELTRRQAEVLPNLYRITRQVSKLHEYISYVLNDKYIKPTDRQLYWDFLRAEGYSAIDINHREGDLLKPSPSEIGRFYENYFGIAVDEGEINDIDTITRKEGAQFALAAMNIRTLMIFYGKEQYKLFFMAYKNEVFYRGKTIYCLANQYAALAKLKLGKRDEAIEITHKNMEFAIDNNLPNATLAYVATRMGQLYIYLQLKEYYEKARDLLDGLYKKQSNMDLHQPLSYDILYTLGRLETSLGHYAVAEPLLEQACEAADIRFKKEGYKSFIAFYYCGLAHYSLSHYKRAAELFDTALEKMKMQQIGSNYDRIDTLIRLCYAQRQAGYEPLAIRTLAALDDFLKSTPSISSHLQTRIDHLRQHFTAQQPN